MTVVADASPICYLILMGEIELLPKLFSRMVLPDAVLSELSAEGSPAAVREWVGWLPRWVSAESVGGRPTMALQHLHAGERETILLAEAINADLVLLDDKAARRLASERGLRVVGLLGVLVEASNQGLVSLPEAIDRLTHTTFRCSPALLKSVLDRHARR